MSGYRRPMTRRGLRLEWLEDRTTPTTLLVDDSLVAGMPINPSLGMVDGNGNGTLDDGDRVTVGLTSNLTFRTTTNANPAAGSTGVAFSSISAAISAALATSLTDVTIEVAAGTYAEAVSFTNPAGNPLTQFTIDGLTGNAADVVIAPAGGAGITIDTTAAGVSGGIILSDLRVAGATTGVLATGITNVLTLSNVQVQGQSGTGLDATGTGATTASLIVDRTTVTAVSGQQAVDISGFAAVNLTYSSVPSVGGAAQSTLVFPAALANATLSVLTPNSGGTVTATGTGLQLGAGEAVLGLANLDVLNLTGGTGADTFVVTPAATGGPAITLNAGQGPGDVLDVGNTAGLTVTSTIGANGLSGSVTSGSTATLNFSNVESFTGASAITGTVFVDTDQNGTQNGGEGGFTGATVFLDVNGNNVPNAGELTATTTGTGAFTFPGLPPGTYAVRVATPTGTTLTTSATPPGVVISTLGETTTPVNFGLAPTGTGTTGGTVTGTVYADLNRTGAKDSGEAGIRGVTVFLDLNGDGKLTNGEPSAAADANGDYSLTTTQNGTFTVRPLLSPGYLNGTTFPQATLIGGLTAAGKDIGVTTNLPPQATPFRRVAAGYIVGGQARVRVMSPEGQEIRDLVVFQGLAMRDVRVAVGDVTGDGVEDVIVGTGPGVPAQVLILDGTSFQEIARLTPFETFAGGVYVAAGDVTGDGINDVIISPDEGGGPRVLVYRGGAAGASGTFQPVASFFGIDDANFRGGARVSVADVNADGTPDLIVAAGFGGGPRIAVFNGSGITSGTLTRLFNDFFIFEEALRNGAFISAGDMDGDGFADLIGGGGPGGGPRVLALSSKDLVSLPPGQAKVLANFFAGDQSNRGGIRVTAKDLDGDGKADIVAGAGRGGGGRLTAFNDDLSERFSFEANSDDRGGVFVG